MARIRTIKPELWSSADFLALSNLGRLAFLAMIGNADDYGRLKTDAGHLSKTYLNRAATSQVQDQLDVMASRHMVQQYVTDGTPCLALLNWKDHQRIFKPTPSRIPEPPFDSAKLPLFANSNNFASHAHAKDRIGPDRKGPEGTGPEGTGVDRSGPEGTGPRTVALSATANGDAVRQVFERWIESTHRSDRTVLDAKRRRLILGALKSYALEDVLDAVEGWEYDPHHRGENDRRRPYNDLELILRDAKHIEQFRAFKRGGLRSRGRLSALDQSVERDLASAQRLRESGQ